jgi:hypothetical protein
MSPLAHHGIQLVANLRRIARIVQNLCQTLRQMMLCGVVL